MSYQLTQSLIAVGSGGWFGRGFGKGMQQAYFVPFPYSDFVASNVGEEWGFVGIAGITIAFAAYALLGFRIARQARTPFLQLVAVGLTFTTVLTAFLHIGVVIGLLPTTGLTLPFISYGRSNLVLTMLFTGILVNIGSERERVVGSSATDPLAAAAAPERRARSLSMTRIIFAGGGTGGHLYPGIAIARALVRARPSIEPFFVGARRGIERDVLPTTEFPHALLDLHPLYRSAVWNNWKTVVGAVGAWRQIGRLVRAQRPAAVVGTGGYAAGMMQAYSVVHRIPLVQQVGDSYPGLTARAFSRWSREIYLNFPEAAGALKAHHAGSLIDTGAPIEPPPSPRPDRRAARARLGISRGRWPRPARVRRKPGLAGDQSRRRASGSSAGFRATCTSSGEPGGARTSSSSISTAPRVRVRAYLSPIADAYAATDLALSRAGAMTTAELFAWNIPAVLVPLPTAAADHQTTNAVTLERAGAAVNIPQAQLTTDRLDETMRRLLGDDAALRALSNGAAARARPDAAADIARRILALIDSA